MPCASELYNILYRKYYSKMETTFLVIFTLFLLFQIYVVSSNETMITTSSNVTCIERERKSLLVFKQGLINVSNRLSTWTGVECCEWHGVGCDRGNGHVVKIDLRSPRFLNTGNWLRGEVSPLLLNLEHLNYLDLSMNNFSGQNIPEFFGSFKYLEYLNLSHSGFGGTVPHHLGNLSRLQYLDLSYNDLYRYGIDIGYGNSLMIKDDLQWVSSLSSLKHLDFSGIEIGKHIDWFHPVNMLPSLLTLNLAHCNIIIPSTKFINFTSLNSLDLSQNDINSTIPVWLLNLTGLVHLDLHDNSLHGRIPGFLGTLSSLASIDLSSNRFNNLMPDLFWNLSSLVCLDLSSNAFHGPVPADVKLGNLGLKELSLSSNQLSGSIPESIGKLSRLQVLYLDNNQLSGSIPESIGQLSMLEHLYLSGNQLSGNIPTSLGQLSNLQYLYLYSNQLSGNIPTSLGQLSNLQSLSLWNNSLVGVVSEIHFAKLNNLADLSLSDNSLTWNVSPGWIPPFQLMVFGASSCNVGPQFPSLIQKSVNLERLYLSNSSIREIPEWFENISSHIYHLDLSHNQIRGRLPKMNPGLESVLLGKNGFTGSVPAHLCELHSIKLLDLSQNNFSGILPDCLGSLTELQVIDLSDNTINGNVPSSLGSLSYLKSLHLHNNKFEGNLPVSLQNLTRLVILDLGNNILTGNIPFWIGKKLSKLKILNLQSNKFMGKIPLELCQINALQHLNLANNSITGTIPRCFCNLTGMIGITISSNDDFRDANMGLIRYYYEENIVACIKGIQWKYTKTIRFLTSLDLSNNNITGDIPNGLMNLVALNNLNLSRNELSGEIPLAIGNLKQIESLDLSMNNLFGRIPPGLASLTFLSYLNLSFNKLSGKIPVGNQLQTFDDPGIYEGNNELCGSPLPRSCKGNNPSYTNVGDDEGKDGSEGLLWFYIGMVQGFVVGCMGLIGSLYFISIWRVTYFKMIENVYAWLKVSVLRTVARLRGSFSNEVPIFDENGLSKTL